MHWRLLLIGCCLLLLLSACQEPSDGQLTVVFPLETTELTGGRTLRVTVSLEDQSGQPVKGATVQAELRTPSGDVLTTIPCADQGQGRYLADYVQLPLQGVGGTWRVIVRATWGDGKQAQGQSTFKGLPSLSEKLQSEYGFWVEIPKSYDCANRSLQHMARRYEDGSGRVLIDNHCHGAININVFWQHADFPADEASVIAIAREQTHSLQPNTSTVLDHKDLLEPDLIVQQTTFKEQAAWHVFGRWRGTTEGEGAGGEYVRSGSIEWMIFRCPGSDWLWTVVISTTSANESYMEDLRATRETFECPTSK